MISVFGSAVGPEELAAVAACLEAQWMGAGPRVAEFERAFAARLHLDRFAMVSSGSNALYLAVRLLGLRPGTQVILPSITWVACAQAVSLCGCEPVFADVDVDTLNVTADTLAPLIGPRTGAVMVVHYAGKPVDMAPIQALGVPVIEDAAHAVDSHLHGRACGSIGEVGIYSFDAVKNLASPEGGGITARDADRFARVSALRYSGIEKSGFDAVGTGGRWWEHTVVGVAPKLLCNDVSAAIALAQLARLDGLQARRRAIWRVYQDAFAGLDWLVRPPEAGPDEQHSYFTYCVRVLPAGARDRLAAHLYARGIYTTFRYHPLHLSPLFGTRSRLPVAERLAEEGLNLPLHPRLSDDDVATVIEAVRAFARRAG